MQGSSPGPHPHHHLTSPNHQPQAHASGGHTHRNQHPPAPASGSANGTLLLRVGWLLLGVGFVAVSAFALFTILVKGSPAPSTAPAEQPIARNEDTPPPPPPAPEDELLPSGSAPDVNDRLARASEIDRVLGHGFNPAANNPAPPPLPPPPTERPTAPVEPPPAPPAPPQPKDPNPAPPAPQPVKPAPANPDEAVEKRLQASEADLREQLLAVPELRLFSDLEVESFRDMEKSQERSARRVGRSQIDYAFNVRLNQAMRKAGVKEGLPLQSGPRCQMDASTAMIVQTLSKSLRDLGFVSVPGVPGLGSFVRRRGPKGVAIVQPNVAASADEVAKEKLDSFKEWCDENRVEKFRGSLATLLQMLQVEDAPTRLVLVRELDKVKSPASTAVLAKRAVVDLSPEVRQAAVMALQKRPAGQYVPILMQSLRYPWSPVADHAALALRTLKPDGAVPKLVALLDQPDPSVPVLDAKSRKQSVRELVRLNHMRNCLLCHAPSANDKDGVVRGLVPTPGQPLPRLYYAGQTGNFVRADTTFLRQDFSVNMPVKAAAPWPNEQRFDFITRVRTVKPGELPEVARKPGDLSEIARKPGDYLQREAVAYALRGLTGKDGGNSADKWRDLLGIAKDNDPNLDKTAKDRDAKLDPTAKDAKRVPEKTTEKADTSATDKPRQP